MLVVLVGLFVCASCICLRVLFICLFVLVYVFVCLFCSVCVCVVGCFTLLVFDLKHK